MPVPGGYGDAVHVPTQCIVPVPPELELEADPELEVEVEADPELELDVAAEPDVELDVAPEVVVPDTAPELELAGEPVSDELDPDAAPAPVSSPDPPPPQDTPHAAQAKSTREPYAPKRILMDLIEEGYSLGFRDEFTMTPQRGPS